MTSANYFWTCWLLDGGHLIWERIQGWKDGSTKSQSISIRVQLKIKKESINKNQQQKIATLLSKRGILQRHECLEKTLKGFRQDSMNDSQSIIQVACQVSCHLSHHRLNGESTKYTGIWLWERLVLTIIPESRNYLQNY